MLRFLAICIVTFQLCQKKMQNIVWMLIRDGVIAGQSH